MQCAATRRADSVPTVPDPTPDANAAASLSHDDIVRIFGPWARRTPTDAAALFAGYPGHWWIAGGWAIESFTGVSRTHGDLDPSIPRSELPLLRRHLAGRLDLWTADSTLR